MAAPSQDDALTLTVDAARRARALREVLARDGASVAGYEGWPEGSELYGEAMACLERMILQLEAGADTPVPAPTPENSPS